MRFARHALSWMVALFSIGYAALMFGYFGHLLQPRGLGSLLVGIAIIGLPLANAILPFWDRRRAGIFGIYSSAGTAAIFAGTLIVQKYHWLRDRYFWGGIGIILAFSALILLPAIFWRIAARRNWPTLTISPRFGIVFAAGLTVLLGTFISLMFAVHQAQLGDCDFYARPYTARQRPEQVLVRARIAHSDPIFGTIAIVDHHYWGMPWWDHRIVLLKPIRGWDQKDVLFDGRRFDGLVTRFLPVIYFWCSTRTRLIENAEVDLRVLRDGPRPGVRILGRVTTEHSYTDYDLIPKPGVVVEAVGGGQRFVSATDEKGVYDFKNLPLADYKVKLADEGEQKICDPFPSYEPVARKSGDVGECNFTFPPPSSPRKQAR